MPRVLTILLLTLLAGPARGKPFDAVRWLEKHPKAAARLGSLAPKVVDSPIEPKSKRWLLHFSSRDARGSQALTLLEKAHQIDPRGKMEHALRDHADRLGEEGYHDGPERGELLDGMLKLRTKIARLERRPPLVIMVDGPDAAGKSSTIRRLTAALSGPYTVLPRTPHLGRPADGVPWESWVRAQLGAPRRGAWLGAGQALIVDRSLLGQVVYGSDPPATARRKVAELEAKLQREYGVTVLHVVQIPSRKAVTDTYGKRLAYELFDVEGKPRVGPADAPAFANLKQVRAKFTAVAKAPAFRTSTFLVDSSDRLEARLAILDWLGEQLKARAGTH